MATPAPKTAVPDARRADRRNAESGEVAEIPDPTYYPAKQLDVYPALSAPLDLSRVASAGAGGVAGRALLLVLIDAVGTVNDVSVVEVEPAGFAEYAQDEAKRAFLSAHFTPAYRHGRAVRSRVLIEVTYGRQ